MAPEDADIHSGSDWNSGRTSKRALLSLAGDPVVEVQVIVATTVTAGRLSSNPICLRCEPVSESGNYERTLEISGRHFELTNRGEYLEIRDLSSRNGTFVDGKRLTSGEVVPLGSGSIVSAAGIVELEIETVRLSELDQLTNEPLPRTIDNAATPESVAFARVRRLDNPALRKHVVLYHWGSIGTHDAALFPLPPEDSAPRVRRRFDLVFQAAEMARLTLRSGELWLSPVGETNVEVNGCVIAKEGIRFAECRNVQVGSRVISVELLVDS